MSFQSDKLCILFLLFVFVISETSCQLDTDDFMQVQIQRQRLHVPSLWPGQHGLRAGLSTKVFMLFNIIDTPPPAAAAEAAITLTLSYILFIISLISQKENCWFHFLSKLFNRNKRFLNVTISNKCLFILNVHYIWINLLKSVDFPETLFIFFVILNNAVK